MTWCHVLPSLGSSQLFTLLIWGGTYQFWHTRMDPLECTSASGIPDICKKIIWEMIFYIHVYHIAGNFRGRKLLWIVEKYDFRGENFADCSLLLRQRAPRSQISGRKLSQIATQPQNSWKFSPSKFPAIWYFMVGKEHSWGRPYCVSAQCDILISEEKWSAQTIIGTAVDPTLTPTTKVKS